MLLLVARRGDPWRWAAAALVVATTAALAPLALEQRGTGHADYIGDSSLVTRTLQLAKQLLVGYASPAQTLTAVVAGVLAAFAVARVVAVADRPHARVTLLVAAVGLGSVAAAFVLALAGLDYLNTRNLLPVLLVLAVVARRRLRRPARARRRSRRRRAAGRAAARRDDPRLDEPALPARRLARGLRRPRPPGGRARDRREPRLGPAAPRPVPGGLRPMPARGAAVSEVDVVAIPRRRSGGGAGAPPPAVTPPFLPPGWFPAAARRTRTYTIVRYARAAPRRC